MCGIAAAIGMVSPAVRTAVHAIHDAQRHRGPDGEGMWEAHVHSSHGIMLAHRRLAIIDLTHDAAQPMIDPMTCNAICFNGEIYNYRELRRELQELGCRFRTTSDTEVLLQAWGKWGPSSIERLRGMFAFVVWDESKRTAYCVRDRLGIKPLYYATIDVDGRRTVLVASEARALLASNMLARRLNTTALGTVIHNGFVVGEQSIVDGVRLLPEASFIAISDADVSPRPRTYWRIPAEGTGCSSVEELQAELREAVRLRLISDVPLGVFLSGGVDSCAVTALAVAETGNERGAIKTFNIAFEEAGFDESRYARQIAEVLGTDHNELVLTEHMFSEKLEDSLRSIDQPTFDAINTYVVSRAVREAGITVALAGTGGDELFGGYRSFRDIPTAAALSTRMAWCPLGVLAPVARAAARIRSGNLGSVGPQTRWGKLADVFAARGSLLDVYQTSYALFSHAFQRSVLNGAMPRDVTFGLPDAFARRLERESTRSEVLATIANLELAMFVSQRLLRDTDSSSMAVALEARVPLLDHKVVEVASRLDSETRFQPLGSKKLLRSIAEERVDPAIFNRPKSGFVLPIERWSRQRLQRNIDEVFHDRLLCESVGLHQGPILKLWGEFQDGRRGVYWSRIWVLFVLLWWCRTYRVTL